jgi:hypothetical protein
VVGELTGGGGDRRRGCLGGCGASPPPPRPGGSSREALERREREALCGAASTGELEREGYGAWDLVWEVEGGEGSLFREEWRLYIGGRGSTGRVDRRPAHCVCRLWE